MVTHLYGILGVILDRTFGNIIRMLRVIRLPKEERGHLSWTFVGTLAVILAYGLIMMFSASYSSGYTNHGGNIYYFIKPQAIVAAVGFVVMLGVSLINYRALRYMFWTFYVITLALLVLALFMPSDNNGCYRWVYLPGGMSLQPSELAKFAVILGTADILDHHQREIKSLFQCVFKPACLLIPILVLLRLEPHNSAMLLMAMIFATMLVCAGAGGVKLWAVVVPAGAAVLVYFIKSLASGDGYASERLGGVWGLTPTDTAGMLWQTRQSIYAISTGGRGHRQQRAKAPVAALRRERLYLRRRVRGTGLYRRHRIDRAVRCPHCAGHCHRPQRTGFLRLAAGHRHHGAGRLAGVLPYRRGHSAAAQHRHQFAVLLLRRHQLADFAG